MLIRNNNCKLKQCIEKFPLQGKVSELQKFLQFPYLSAVTLIPKLQFCNMALAPKNLIYAGLLHIM